MQANSYYARRLGSVLSPSILTVIRPWHTLIADRMSESPQLEREVNMTNYFRPKILCIDDDTNTSTWIRIVLRGARVHASVVSVRSGMEALQLIGKEKFDL